MKLRSEAGLLELCVSGILKHDRTENVKVFFARFFGARQWLLYDMSENSTEFRTRVHKSACDRRKDSSWLPLLAPTNIRIVQRVFDLRAFMHCA